MMEVKGMADKQEKEVVAVGEPKVGPERMEYEKEVRGGDRKALYTLLGSGAICGVCMWVAFSFVGGTVIIEDLVGAVIGGLISGAAIYALT